MKTRKKKSFYGSPEHVMTQFAGTYSPLAFITMVYNAMNYAWSDDLLVEDETTVQFMLSMEALIETYEDNPYMETYK